VDLEQFYDADPRRRHSEELEFGADWQENGARTQVSWVEATGEIYSMRDPLGHLDSGLFGDEYVEPEPDEALGVQILGIITGRDAISAVMSGWDKAMAGGENSLTWVRDRIANAATEAGDPPATPSHDLPA
jgi:hypothetical protein